MTTTMTRFEDVPPQTLNHQSDTGKASKSNSPVANQPVIKDETTQRTSCPYTNERTQNAENSRVNGEQVGKAKDDSPQRSLSPEFFLGASKKSEQEQKTTEGPAQVVNTVTCVYCNEKFPNKKAQDLHIATIHGDAGTKLYDCSVCEKRFTHRSSRDIHLRVHTGLRPYECDYCKKRFRVSSHLRDHVRTHTGERPFKCEICGRGFKQSSDMKKHRKTHFKTMAFSPVINTECATSYMVVRPEETTNVDRNPNDLRSPTDQRQNLKLVIKRERKPSDIKSPSTSDNNTIAASGNNTQPGEKPSEDSTRYVELSTNMLPTSNKEANTNWAPNSYSDVNAIRSTKERLPKKSPAKVAVKRKAGPKSSERNGYKPNTSYPSMAIGFGQIYTPTGSVNHSRQDPKFTTPHSNMDGYNSSNQTGNSQNQQTQYGDRLRYDNQMDNIQNQQAQYGNRLSYENQMGKTQDQQAQHGNEHSFHNQTTMPSQTQNGEHSENDVFWQPEKKVIKTEKLSPNSHEQSAYGHEVPTYNHEQATINHEQLTSSHGKPTHGHEQQIHGHEFPTYDHERPTYSHELPMHEDATMNVDDEQTYTSDVAMTTNEELTNNHVNSNPDINSVTKQRADVSAYTETQALANTSTKVTELPEDNVDVLPEDSEVVPSNTTSATEVIVRKPMVVKLRRDKTGVVKISGTGSSVRKIKSKEQEDVQCAFCDKALENQQEPTAHKCGKNSKAFKCTVCNKVFARATLLRQHMVLHQGIKRFRFKCNYCGRAFRHRSHLRDHERIHTGERPFKCSFCPKAFKQSSDHRKHENLHTGTTRYRCEKCSLDFKRCDALKRHAMLHTEGEVSLLKCEKCRSLFATADGHTSHVCLNKPYRYRCQICPERFTAANDLRRHCYELHGEQSTISCLKCEFCKMEFDNLEELDEHLGTHRLEKTHTCKTCDQRFSMLNQLVEHMKLHNTAPRAVDHPPGISPSSLSQSEPSTTEQTSTTITHQTMEEISLNVMPAIRAAHTSHKPNRPKYDFIPSKYQSLTPTNSIYGKLAVGNWARPHNVYLPIRPKDPGNDGNPRRQDEAASISPRDNPIASRSNVEFSRNNPTSFRSTTETSQIDPTSSRRNTESSEINPASLRRNTESSEINPISSRRNTESSGLSPTSSESFPIAARPTTIANTVNAYPQTSPTTMVDECSTSFSTYRAIALSKNAFRGNYRNKPSGSQLEQTTSRNEPADTRQKTHNSIPVNNPSGPAVQASHLEVRNNTDADSSEIHRNPEEIRRNSEQPRMNPDVIRRYHEQTLMNLDESRQHPEKIRSNSEEIRITSDGTRRNYESDQIGPIRTRENTVIFEKHIADKSLSNGSASSHGSQGQLSESQRGQLVTRRKYTCLNCRLEFYQESSLVDHVCEILSETLYFCLVCEVEFDKYEDLQVHMRTHWRPVVYFKCTLCGHRMRSEELLKEHHLKHLKDAREEHREGYGHDEVFTTTADIDGYHRIANGNARDDPNDPPEAFISPPGSAKSVTSPVICSVSGNIVTKKTTLALERGYKERRSSNMEIEVGSNTSIELANQNALSLRDDVIPRSSHRVPNYEARKQASGGYLPAQFPAIVVSAMHAAMENSGRYPVPNALLYPPARTRSGYTVKHH